MRSLSVPGSPTLLVRRAARTSSRDSPRGSFPFHLSTLLKLCPMCLDGTEHFRQIDADSLCLHDELLHLVLQQTFPVAGSRDGGLRHNRAHTGTHFKEALLNQVLDHFMCGVGMDLQICR